MSTYDWTQDAYEADGNAASADGGDDPNFSHPDRASGQDKNLGELDLGATVTRAGAQRADRFYVAIWRSRPREMTRNFATFWGLSLPPF